MDAQPVTTAGRRKRRVRLIHDGGDPLFLRVEDADTGRQIHGVVRFAYEVDMAKRSVVASVDVQAEIDVVVDAELRRLRLNDETGDYELVEH